MCTVSSALMRSDDIVPFAVKLIWVQIERLHVVLGDFAARRILAAIQAARNGQSLCGRRLRNQIDDRFVVPQGLAAPV